jgi:hypothetical protein
VVNLLLALGNGILHLSDESRMALGRGPGLDGVGDLVEGVLPVSRVIVSSLRELKARDVR